MVVVVFRPAARTKSLALVYNGSMCAPFPTNKIALAYSSETRTRIKQLLIF